MGGTAAGGLFKIAIAALLAWAWSQGLLSNAIGKTTGAFTAPRPSSGSVTVFGRTLRVGAGPAIPTSSPTSSTPRTGVSA